MFSAFGRPVLLAAEYITAAVIDASRTTDELYRVFHECNIDRGNTLTKTFTTIKFKRKPGLRKHFIFEN